MVAGGTTAVLGFGVTGQSVVRHLRRAGVTPVVLDTRAPQQLVAPEFADLDIRWDQTRWPDIDVDEAVLSPGLALDDCLVAGARRAGVHLVSDIDVFFANVPAGAYVIGITGTNGKSTVTAWAGHLLESAGIDCAVGGNIGDAALDLLEEEHAGYVLELSSFQLERSGELPLACAAVLNVTEDHLDVHGDMQQYQASKHRIYARAERLIYDRDDPRTVPARREGAVSFGLGAPLAETDWGVVEIAGEQQLCRGRRAVLPVAALPLPGDHNVLNALAACALVEPWVELAGLAEGLTTFRGLAHRFERVAEVAGVVYVNDSKATNLGAAMAALGGLPLANQVVLIAGGDPKGVDLEPLAALLPGRVKHLICIGLAASDLAGLAQSAGVSAEVCEDLQSAVAVAAGSAAAGDMVLLSPACASLDMFTSYRERGERFAEAVHALEVI